MFKNSIAVIIAGGQSSRMLQDKALLPFGDYTSLAEYQYRRLNKIFSKVYISAKENKFNFDVNIIKDVNKISSPLVALVSIFETLECDEVFVLSVDAPFVEKSVIKKLYEAKKLTDDIVVISSKNGVEPLCAIYKRSFLNKAKIALKKSEHRLKSLFDILEVNRVFIEDESFFLNLNYPHDYEVAKKIISSHLASL